MATIYKGTMMSDDETAVLYPKTTADNVVMTDGTNAEVKINSKIDKTATCNKNWQWVAQGGSPSYIWGGDSAGKNFYAYSPLGMSVLYATGAANLNASPAPTASGGARYLAQMIIGSAVPTAETCPPGCIYGQP